MYVQQVGKIYPAQKESKQRRDAGGSHEGTSSSSSTPFSSSSSSPSILPPFINNFSLTSEIFHLLKLVSSLLRSRTPPFDSGSRSSPSSSFRRSPVFPVPLSPENENRQKNTPYGSSPVDPAFETQVSSKPPPPRLLFLRTDGLLLLFNLPSSSSPFLASTRRALRRYRQTLRSSFYGRLEGLLCSGGRSRSSCRGGGRIRRDDGRRCSGWQLEDRLERRS